MLRLGRNNCEDRPVFICVRFFSLDGGYPRPISTIARPSVHGT